ncbi:hypothetical protein PLEOSDRAFT_1036066 [Pleurotus ostreatus PC15]|uniref:Uncharacterized protein n=1 Tax=Pleurotus ostreatus (strain PC15) TaxID=1137138 RepID=A0A067P0W2_PLEO1|nr:hypothetical protein PLEOSDRAFT_1036066 [Pleurotus ostreatus PC15]
MDDGGNDGDDESEGLDGEGSVSRDNQIDGNANLPVPALACDEADFPIRPLPPLKRHKLEVPARVTKAQARENRQTKLESALTDITKLLKSERMVFHAGKAGLEASRARAIQSYLRMVLKNQCRRIDASEQSAESQGFAVKHGGRQVRLWTKEWVEGRKLPSSQRGRHGKSFSFLSDPAVRAELRSYVRSNKWAMDPKKLADFSANKLAPDVAAKYLREIVDKEMPAGLKRYMEVELFPRIHLKVAKGISYMLLAHDEMTSQVNDGKKRSWVLEGEQPLKKKGVGRGVHQSDVVCSTFGWLPEASQTLEYGKNYDGYWTGELFVKQLIEKIIPTFEKYHGAGYKALILVDNSQGHSAYAKDALLTSRMNMRMRPGGKQPRMKDGWFMRSEDKIPQRMVFPLDHPEFPDQPKGMKQRYLHEHCDYTFTTLQENMPKALQSVDVSTIRKWEHRMYRWMDAYRGGLGAKDAQTHVRKYSSTVYKSHRRIPERLAQQFDQ